MIIQVNVKCVQFKKDVLSVNIMLVQIPHTVQLANMELTIKLSIVPVILHAPPLSIRIHGTIAVIVAMLLVPLAMDLHPTPVLPVMLLSIF